MLLASGVTPVHLNSADIVVLIILAVLFVGGVRVVVGFFRTPKKKAGNGTGEVSERSGAPEAPEKDG